MRFSLEWLKEFLNTTLSPDTLGTTLTNLGLELEFLENQGKIFETFKVAHIKECHKHPDADRLQICRVDVGDDQDRIVVCGAENARAGLWTVYAPIGSMIPTTQTVLKPTKIRGVASDGMLCSAAELGLSTSSNGIIELQRNLIAGHPFSEVCPHNDIIFDLNITPNRPDCFGVFGIARDLAAKEAGLLKPLSSSPIEGKFKSPIQVSMEDSVKKTKACPQFMGRFIKGVKNRPSPEWLQKRLTSSGLTPISALVDITNYLCLGHARPLHVFDAGKLEGHLEIRFAREGEQLEALNGKTYSLDSSILVIADNKNVQSLAGIMGGAKSGCSLETTDVFLECALFDAILIGKTGQNLIIQSDARQRFERGVDPESCTFGINEATRLILEICGGAASEVIDLLEIPYEPRTLSFNFDTVEKKTGVFVSPHEITSLLKNLGFTVILDHSDSLTLEIPSWRPDIQLPEDLVEEVIRVKGYNLIPETPLPPFKGTYSTQVDPQILLSPFQQKQLYLKRVLTDRGYLETVTYSFISSSEASFFGLLHDDLTLSNPISSDMDVMRPSIIPSLLKALLKNHNNGLFNLSLFELASIYLQKGSHSEQLTLTGIRKGETHDLHWGQKPRPFDLFDVKADIFKALAATGISESSVQISREGIPAYFHPHLSGAIRQGPKNILGFFGVLHPKIIKAFDLNVEDPCVAFELYLDALPISKPLSPLKSISLSPFPKAQRDFAFLMKRTQEVAPLLEAIKRINPQLIEEVLLFDVYTGKGVEEGEKSVAIRLVLIPYEDTLKDEEIKTLSQKVIEAAQKSVGATLRA